MIVIGPPRAMIVAPFTASEPLLAEEGLVPNPHSIKFDRPSPSKSAAGPAFGPLRPLVAAQAAYAAVTVVKVKSAVFVVPPAFVAVTRK